MFEPKYKWYESFTFLTGGLIILGGMFLFYIFAGLNGSFNMNDPFESYPFLYDLSYASFMPILIIVLPTIGGGIQLFFSRRTCYSRDTVVISLAFITFILSTLLYPSAKAGGILVEYGNVLGLGISFRVDMLGYIMLLITSILWFLVMVYAHAYMFKEKRCNRFFFFMALTYSSVLGTIVAGDLLTMFLFFEMMTITSYMLVTHGQNKESYQAGYNYIFMGLLGGFAIFGATAMMYYIVGDLTFASAITTLNQHGNLKYWIFGLLLFGFGVKAGMAPVHVWLPRAHPVAPTPASALLSGIMIKVGAFGVLRVATSFYFPEPGTLVDRFDDIWLTAETIGGVIIWVGIVTMAIGVFLALQQSNIKRMLAYHSISQMGYIVMGIGVSLYLGYIGAMGYSGSILHIVNHALFKSLLFMVAGSVYLHTKENDMYKLGGLWKKLPLTAAVALVAALGISGIPLFNGFVSKTILHHGIVEAYEYGYQSFLYAEWIFIIISAGTVCSFIKLFYYVFLGDMPKKYKAIKPKLNSLDVSMVAIALIIIFIGLNPTFMLNMFVIPQISVHYDSSFIDQYIIGMNVFTFSDVFIMIPIVMIGILIFIFGTKFHLFHLTLPKWLRVEYIFFYPTFYIMRGACKIMYGDQCPIDTKTVQKVDLKHNYDVGFLDRFVVMSNMFDRRYEKQIIESDALIYTVFITLVIVILMFV